MVARRFAVVNYREDILVENRAKTLYVAPLSCLAMVAQKEWAIEPKGFGTGNLALGAKKMVGEVTILDILYTWTLGGLPCLS